MAARRQCLGSVAPLAAGTTPNTPYRHAQRVSEPPNIDYSKHWPLNSDTGGYQVKLEGWNHIPAHSGATFNLTGAPRWLVVMNQIPFVDRFSYPILVRRGYGMLHPDNDGEFDVHAAAAKGWTIEDANGTISQPLSTD